MRLYRLTTRAFSRPPSYVHRNEQRATQQCIVDWTLGLADNQAEQVCLRYWCIIRLMLIPLLCCPPNHSPSSVRACLHNMSHICACYRLLLAREIPSFFNPRSWPSTLHLRETILTTLSNLVPETLGCARIWNKSCTPIAPNQISPSSQSGSCHSSKSTFIRRG